MTATPRSSSEDRSLFATTRWSLLGDLGGGQARDSLASIFSIYWSPLYRYVRRRGLSVQDAEDIVQGFFAHLLEKEGLRLVDRDKGRFRAFLLGALKHYMANDWRRAHREKRGSFIPHLSLDWERAESALRLEAQDNRSPDQIFDQEWALALLEKVMSDLQEGEAGAEFSRWKSFLSMKSDRISYAEIAAEFGMNEGAARVAVHRLRRLYRHALRAEIARTLASPDLVDQEMQALFAALSGKS